MRAIEPIHRALVMSAMSHSVHVTSLMDHHMACIIQEFVFVISIITILFVSIRKFRVKSEETEYSSARCVQSPSKAESPTISWIKILHGDSKHAICIIRNKTIVNLAEGLFAYGIVFFNIVVAMYCWQSSKPSLLGI